MFNSDFYIVTKTPLRISFFGGGTDFEYFYKRSYGQVISSAINKYVYVCVKSHNKLFKEDYRLNYSSTETVSNLKYIKNDIIRECLKIVPIKPPIYISFISDIPTNSGLGSSSSFVVGLLKALFELRKEKKTPKEIAEIACTIEINILKNPIGKQDQYAASFGNFMNYKFFKDNKVYVSKINNNSAIKKIFSNSLLVWTGKFRKSKTVLSDQKNRIIINKKYLYEIRTLVDKATVLLKEKKFNLIAFANLLNESWLIKKRLTGKMSSKIINNLYNGCLINGGLGGKILGAGGGGFLFIIFKKNKKKKLFNFLKKKYFFQCLSSKDGAKIIYKL
jgi:D-glycero-alpha-D-manno-heptose-7-phosphate kinase